MDEKSGTWGRSGSGLPENWPMNEKGEPEQPALLDHPAEGAMADLTANLLEAYGIPVYKSYREDGTFARVMFGASAYGVELYVPASRLDEAGELLEAVPQEPEDGTEE